MKVICNKSNRCSAVRRAEQRFSAPIVCLCGSTRFKQTWIAENARLTGEGNIVLAVGLWGHHERKQPDTDTKTKLDALHLRKIDLCDWVFVLDVGGYTGESTRREIAYAENKGLPVRYLSREFPNYVEPVDEVLQRAEAAEKACAGMADSWQRGERYDCQPEHWKEYGYDYIPKSQLDEARKALKGCVDVFIKLAVHYCPLCKTGPEVEHKPDCPISLANAAAEKVTGGEA